GHKSTLNAAPLAGADSKHDLHEGIAGADPRYQSGVGAHLRSELGRILSDDFLTVKGVKGNALEDHTNESKPACHVLSVKSQDKWVILPVPGSWAIGDRARRVCRNRTVKQLVGMNQG